MRALALQAAKPEGVLRNCKALVGCEAKVSCLAVVLRYAHAPGVATRVVILTILECDVS
jgi:hypothetical protein